MMKRAVLYARVSGDDTGKDGRNLSGQLDMCREYAQRQDWQIVAELAEDERGVSGARMDAPQLTRAIDMAAGGLYDVLVVRELDRLARGLAKQLIVEEELKRSGVQIDYVLGEYAQTPEGQLSKQIRAVIAEYEREKIRERSMRGRRQSVKSGNVLTHGRPPFGYTFTKVDGRGRLEIDEKTAATVRLIFDLYADGATIRELATALEGIPTPMDIYDYPGLGAKKRRPPGEWSSSSLNRFLTNETYAGRFTYGGLGGDEPISVNVPAIIKPEVWEAVQKRRVENQRIVASRARSYQYLIAGRGRCGHCGLAMHSLPIIKKNRKTRLYYRCPSKNTAKYTRTCDLPYFNAAVVDLAVWTAVRTYLTEPDKLQEGIRRYAGEREQVNAPIRQQVGIVHDLIREHEEKLARLLDLYLAGEFDRALLADKKQQLERVIGDLTKRRDDLQRQLGRQLSPADIEGIQTLVSKVGAKIEAAEQDFEFQRRILNKLGVVVTFAFENGERVLYLSGEIGEIGSISLSQDDKSPWASSQMRVGSLPDCCSPAIMPIVAQQSPAMVTGRSPASRTARTSAARAW